VRCTESLFAVGADAMGYVGASPDAIGWFWRAGAEDDEHYVYAIAL